MTSRPGRIIKCENCLEHGSKALISIFTAPPTSILQPSIPADSSRRLKMPSPDASFELSDSRQLAPKPSDHPALPSEQPDSAKASCETPDTSVPSRFLARVLSYFPDGASIDSLDHEIKVGKVMTTLGGEKLKELTAFLTDVYAPEQELHMTYLSPPIDKGRIEGGIWLSTKSTRMAMTDDRTIRLTAPPNTTVTGSWDPCFAIDFRVSHDDVGEQTYESVLFRPPLSGEIQGRCITGEVTMYGPP